MKNSSKIHQKSILNFIINTIMTFCMSAVIGIGFLIKYALISGKERWEIYGSNVNLSVLGMDRHQWGMLHLILGFILFGLLVVHVFLHWKVVTTVYQKIIKQTLAKKVVAFLFAMICLLMIITPFFINPDLDHQKNGKDNKVILVTQANFG